MTAALNPSPLPADTPPTGVGATSMAFSDANRAFRTWLTERHYSDATIRQYAHYFERALVALDAGGITLEGATVQDLSDWWRTLPQTSESRNGARKALVAFYKSIGRKRGEPADELPSLPEGSRLPRPVTEDAFTRLRAAAVELGGIHEVIGLLLASTGCRISEARTARWDQFELAGASPVWFVEGKGAARRGKKERVVPLTGQLVATLRGWQRANPSTAVLFPSTHATKGVISDSTMRIRVREIVDHAGLDHVVPHRWRHSWATTALERTNDLRGVQELLGHSNPSTTQRYTQVSPDRLRSIVDALPG